MNANLNLLQKNAKIDTIILLTFCMLFAILTLSYISKIKDYSKMNNSSFEVKLADTDTLNHTNNYYLFIQGELNYPVNYNYYFRLDSTGHTNVKANVIMDCINGAVRDVLMLIIFILLYQVRSEVKKGLDPFSRYCVSVMRKAALFSFLLALLPNIIEEVGSLMVFKYLTLDFSSLNFYVITMGVIFVFLSKIFKYGCELRDDIDQIA